MKISKQTGMNFITISSVLLFILPIISCTGSYNENAKKAEIFIHPSTLLTANDIATSKDHNTLQTYTPDSVDLKFCENVCYKEDNNFFFIFATFNKHNIIVQKGNFDCWAAASAMLLKYSINNFSEDQFYKSFRISQNQTLEAKDQLSVYKKILSNYSKATVSQPLRSDFLYYSLANQFPILVGLKDLYQDGAHHIVVLIGAFFSFSERSFVRPNTPSFIAERFMYVDPYDGKIKVINAEEFVQKVDFGISFLPFEIIQKGSTDGFMLRSSDLNFLLK